MVSWNIVEVKIVFRHAFTSNKYLAPFISKRFSGDHRYLKLFADRKQVKVCYRWIIRSPCECLAPSTRQTRSLKNNLKFLLPQRFPLHVKQLSEYIASMALDNAANHADDEDTWEVPTMAEIRNILHLLCTCFFCNDEHLFFRQITLPLLWKLPCAVAAAANMQWSFLYQH